MLYRHTFLNSRIRPPAALFTAAPLWYPRAMASHARPPRRWVFALGALLIPVNSFWIARTEAMDYSGFPTCASLFYNVIFCLIVLALANAIARRTLPGLALSQWELLIVYAMVATGSSLVGHDTMQMVVPTIPHAALFADRTNRWREVLIPHLPGWLTINQSSPDLMRYRDGHGTLYTWEALKAWIVPVSAWSFFLLSTIASMLAVTCILRRRWVEQERLEYPIIQIPLLITESGGAGSIFRTRLFWYGFALAAGLDVLNGLHQFYPLLPYVNLKQTDLSRNFATPPWNAMGWSPISFYPFVVGLSFFMPANMSFSCWFFYLFRKSEMVAYSALGYRGYDAWAPYLKEQAFGALIGLFLATLWFGRHYLREFLGEALGQAGPQRLALVVLCVSLLCTMGFLIIAGMTPALAVAYVVLYLLFVGSMTRIRAEVGPPAHEIGSVGPSHMLILALGSGVLGPKNLALFSLMWFQNRMHRGILMPQQAESLKAASATGMRVRWMVVALAIAAVIGVLSAFWALMALGYGRTLPAAHHPGAPGSGFAFEHYNFTTNLLANPSVTNAGSISWMGVGAITALALARLNTMFYGFPFHPAGYALGMAFGVDYIWFPILLAWALKVLILRYQGLGGYRRAIPFFVGLVLGEFLVGGCWSFLRGVLGIQTYTFFY